MNQSQHQCILAIDQGTSSTRAFVFDHSGTVLSQAQQEFRQYFPQDGWVEHDAEEIWDGVLHVCREAMQQAKINASDIKACGMSNQRETTVIWNKQTGEVVHRAIVWQDRRTADYCEELRINNFEQIIQEKTGLLCDPYFSASKIQWLLTHIPEAQRLAEKNLLAFGTIDSFLIWRFSKGNVHATDVTNASRTLLFNIHSQQWDDDLLKLFAIPRSVLPEVRDCNAHFADIDKSYFGAVIPITGVAGDQQAAAIGQACFNEGMLKATYGTGCFLLLNTGKTPVISRNRLLSTIAYRINGETHYALEGSIFNAGTAVKWLRDNLHSIKNSAETESLASSINDNGGVYFVPAFTGLGAPYWDANARGALFGITRDTSIAHFARAALEAACYQTRDVITAMQADSQQQIKQLRVDGGMVANNWLMQFLANVCAVQVQRSAMNETTIFGAAMLAALGAGLFQQLEDIAAHWQCQALFTPEHHREFYDDSYQSWQQAVQRVML